MPLFLYTLKLSLDKGPLFRYGSLNSTTNDIFNKVRIAFKYQPVTVYYVYYTK